MRFLAPLVPLFFLFLFSYAQTGGTGIPPNESRTLGKQVPDVVLVDSEGEEFNLYSLKGKPVILSPIYTHCTSACPIITESLKKMVSS
ncbi:MAG: SCO family protein, partial [Aquificota bacterium]|nr:SCO family protein [Aquificota bacterium]